MEINNTAAISLQTHLSMSKVSFFFFPTKNYTTQMELDTYLKSLRKSVFHFLGSALKRSI